MPEPDKKYTDEFNVVFTGMVDSVSICDKHSKAYFSVLRIYKGECPRHVPLEFDCSGPCMMNFTKGETWLIYADYAKYGLLSTKLCSRSRKYFTEETKDYYLASSLITFDDEEKLLSTRLGNGEINQEDRQVDMAERSLIRPDGKSALVLITVSVLATLVIWLLFKRYIK